MAFGLLLWLFLICLLQFNSSAGFPAQKGYMKVQSSYNRASVGEWPEVVPAEPILSNKPRAPEVERLVNDEPIDWAPKDFDLSPLILKHPLSSQVMSQPGSIQPQSTSLNVAPSNSMPILPRSADGSTYFASATAYYGPYPTYTPQDDFLQPEQVGSGYGVADLDVFPKTGSNADRGDWHNHRLVFEEVFHYPSENTRPSHLNYGAISNTAVGSSQADHMSNGFSTGYAFMLDERSLPSYAVREGDQPVSRPGTQSSFPSSFSGEANPHYQPQNDKISSRLPQKPGIGAQKVSQRLAKRILHPAQSYIIQLRDGSQQGRYLFNKSWRSSELPPPVPVSSESVKRDGTELTSHPPKSQW